MSGPLHPAKTQKPNGHGKQALRVWLQLLTLTTLIEKRIRKNLLAEFATTLPRFDVLASLDRASGKLTMGELSRRLLVSKGNVTGIVSELERQGLVRRERDAYDRRTHYLELTPKGLKHFRELAAAHRAWVAKLFARAGDRRLQRLLKDLSRVKTAVSDEREEKAA